LLDEFALWRSYPDLGDAFSIVLIPWENMAPMTDVIYCERPAACTFYLCLYWFICLRLSSSSFLIWLAFSSCLYKYWTLYCSMRLWHPFSASS